MKKPSHNINLPIPFKFINIYDFWKSVKDSNFFVEEFFEKDFMFFYEHYGKYVDLFVLLEKKLPCPIFYDDFVNFGGLIFTPFSLTLVQTNSKNLIFPLQNRKSGEIKVYPNLGETLESLFYENDKFLEKGLDSLLDYPLLYDINFSWLTNNFLFLDLNNSENYNLMAVYNTLYSEQYMENRKKENLFEFFNKEKPISFNFIVNYNKIFNSLAFFISTSLIFNKYTHFKFEFLIDSKELEDFKETIPNLEGCENFFIHFFYRDIVNKNYKIVEDKISNIKYCLFDFSSDITLFYDLFVESFMEVKSQDFYQTISLLNDLIRSQGQITLDLHEEPYEIPFLFTDVYELFTLLTSFNYFSRRNVKPHKDLTKSLRLLNDLYEN